MKIFRKISYRRRFFRCYAMHSFRRALGSAVIGFLSGLIVGLQTGQIITVTIIIACLSALLSFLHQVFK
ncbi:MAG: hypothetical protein QXH03_01420 [Candidatus Bathyarchaeia archaeon]